MLSDLIEKGMACTKPWARDYVDEGDDDLACCALGTAVYAELGCQGTAEDINREGIDLYERLSDQDGRPLLKKAGWKRKEPTSLGQAIGIVNDRMMLRDGVEDPRPQIVAWLRELSL